MTDYISREAAFNAVLKLVPKVDDDGYCWVIRGDAATAIDSIPAADVREVKRGKWKGVQSAECSECGHVFPAFMLFEHYCPNCGTEMERMI